MSSTTVVSNSTNNIQIVASAKTPSSTITTTAKSSTTTVTASSKKPRKLETSSADGGTNFLPIAPHQTFYSSNQGLTLASVQQQQLQSQCGSVVFSPQTMMTTLGTGPQGNVQQQGQQQAGQQLVVAAPGQAMGPTFNTANGQGLIQAGPGMGMLTGLPQMIQAGGGSQPTYTFHNVYANHGMQPMALLSHGPNFTMAFPQNHTQGLAIQIPNGNTNNMGSTMITTNQLATNTPNTPVKNQNQNQPMIKSVTISPQQPQATKSGANNAPNVNRVQSQPNQQQQTPTIIQQTFQQNPSFVIGTFQNSANQSNGTAILPNNQNSARKNTTFSRSSSTGHKTPGTNIIQKIQPATTTLTTSPIIAPAQFKSNTSPFQNTANATSPANGQTIMVHGQGIQPAGGGIQLGPNQTIISPLTSFPTIQSGLTWTSPLNQQTTQLVTQSGQPIFFRTGQSGDQPHMLIQTSNNQFQAVPMQMAQGSQQQTSNQQHGTMQMTQTGQSLVTTSINQSLPIIQTNPVTPNAIMTQQSNVTGSSLLTSVTTSQSNCTPTSTPLMNGSRQRPLRPANNTQTTISTQTSTKQKVSLDNRTSIGNVPKLAPKSIPVTSTGLQVNTLTRSAVVPQPAKIPITLTKSNDNQASKSLSSTNTTLVSTTSNKITSAKVSTSTTTQSIAPPVITSLSSATSSSVPSLSNSTVSTSTVASLVINTNAVQPNKVSSPVPPGQKLNRKIDKKDSTGVDSKPNSFPSIANKTAKSNMMNSSRNSTSTTVKSTSTSTSTNTSGHMINGVMCQMQPNNQLKSPIVGGTVSKSSISNGIVSKTSTIQNGLGTPKSKPKQPENLVLTHVIDGYVIQESPNPFPISGFSNSESENQNEKNNQIIIDTTIKFDSKESIQNGSTNKGQELANGSSQKEYASHNGTHKNVMINEQQQTVVKPKLACLVCAKEMLNSKMKPKNRKQQCCSQACQDKLQKATPNKIVLNNPTQMLNSMSPKPLTQPALITNPSPILQVPVQLSLVNLSQGQQIATSLQTAVSQVNGTNVGTKRIVSVNTKEQTNMATPEKRAKLNSPVLTKNESSQPNNKPQNGQLDTNDASNIKDTKADISTNNIPELEGLWLPSGGKDPNKWTVQEVFEFINHMEGCSEFAEDFRSQEIDGLALMLIKEDHIIAIMHMKLGPALKICRKIKDLKSAFNI